MNDSGGIPRRTFVAGAAAAAAVAACSSNAARTAASTPTSTSSAPSPSGVAAPTPTFVSAGPRDRQQVALTFHVNGDRALAVQMLDLLKEHRVTVTAFIVGTWLEANGDLVARFIDDGHELANHTYTHPSFASLDRSAMTQEVTACRDALMRLAATGGTYFRPSGTVNGIDNPGATVLDVANGAGYPTVVGYDVDPADYADPGARLVVQRTAEAVQPGSIVSLHFGHAGTIDAMPEIVSTLGARGLQTVPVKQMLSS